ncbi:tektin-1-like isoform X2 [Gasterosteus aculeatus]
MRFSDHYSIKPTHLTNGYLVEPERCPSWPVASSSPVDVEVTRNESQLIRAECRTAVTEMDTAWRRMQSAVTERLDQRVRDIQFLRKDLEWKLEQITGEADDLFKMSSRLAKALEACRRRRSSGAERPCPPEARRGTSWPRFWSSSPASSG